GAVTAVSERDGDDVIWREFGFETGLDVDPQELDTRQLEDLGPFRFPWPAYQAAIQAGYGLDGFNIEGNRAESAIGEWKRHLKFR
ncbi:MAG: hypothetical protein M3365_07980, partial [Gemmatimonadota bacterium]|nr:hypothetical protein [Gemmatimonadota bacterium]